MSSLFRNAEFEEPEESGELRLLRAILSRAGVDYLSTYAEEETVEVCQLGGTFRRVKVTNEVSAWLWEDNIDPWSFLWICEQISEDSLALATKIRNKLLRKKEQDIISYG